MTQDELDARRWRALRPMLEVAPCPSGGHSLQFRAALQTLVDPPPTAEALVDQAIADGATARWLAVYPEHA